MITKEGRFPCWDCTLKHLGIAAICVSEVKWMHLEDCIERTKIFLAETHSGYPEHRWLAAGVIGLIEIYTMSFDNEILRNTRKDIMLNNAIPDMDAVLEELVTHKISRKMMIPYSKAIMKAHLMEALAECPDEEVAKEIEEYLKVASPEPPPIMDWIFKISVQREHFMSSQELLDK